MTYCVPSNSRILIIDVQVNQVKSKDMSLQVSDEGFFTPAVLFLEVPWKALLIWQSWVQFRTDSRNEVPGINLKR